MEAMLGNADTQTVNDSALAYSPDKDYRKHCIDDCEDTSVHMKPWALFEK